MVELKIVLLNLGSITKGSVKRSLVERTNMNDTANYNNIDTQLTALDNNLNLSGGGGTLYATNANTIGTGTTATIITGSAYQSGISAWNYWQDWYYPNTIIRSYPVYLQERALDKGKQAFEIIKILKDKKLANLEKVADFIDLMDELIKIL